MHPLLGNNKKHPLNVLKKKKKFVRVGTKLVFRKLLLKPTTGCIFQLNRKLFKEKECSATRGLL